MLDEGSRADVVDPSPGKHRSALVAPHAAGRADAAAAVRGPVPGRGRFARSPTWRSLRSSTQLHFSQQNLQWVASGYLLTYGGFLLLGGRLADLLGRRRVLVAGLVVFAVCSLAAGLAQSEGTLIAARLLQGVGAAMMAPAALSILTTTFREGADRNTALGIVGRDQRSRRRRRACSSAACCRRARVAVGVLREHPGVRAGAGRLVPAAPRRAPARAACRLRHAGRAPGHQRHAAARLRADQGPRRRLGQRPDDRDARGRRR